MATVIIVTAVIATMMINDNDSLKFRHEVKFRINRTDDYLLSDKLNKIFKHDIHADSHGIYRVSSLYFDTPYDKALRQKIDGINKREKFRLRYYNGNLSYILLEKKIKINGMCSKQSVCLSKEQVRCILNGDIGFMCKSKNPLLIELYSKMQGELLQPKTIVCYDREAFVFTPGNVRITIDRNIRSGLRSLDFLNANKKMVDVSEEMAVLEVKYDEFLPDVVKFCVQLPNRNTTEYSKYAVCRKYD